MQMRMPLVFSMIIILLCAFSPTIQAKDHGKNGKHHGKDKSGVELDHHKVSLQSFDLSVFGASGLVALKKDLFLVISDKEGIYQYSLNEKPRLIKSAAEYKHLADLEGLTLSSDGRFLYAVTEEKGHVSRIPLKMDRGEVELGEPEDLGKLPEISTVDNKGWEGVAVQLDGKTDILVAVHQNYPKLIGFFRLPDLKNILLSDLPPEASDLMENLSDVTTDPRTGNLLLLSSKSKRILEVEFSPEKPFRMISKTDLDDLKKDDKPEGICLDAASHMFLVTDGTEKLFRVDPR